MSFLEQLLADKLNTALLLIYIAGALLLSAVFFFMGGLGFLLFGWFTGGLLVTYIFGLIIFRDALQLISSFSRFLILCYAICSLLLTWLFSFIGIVFSSDPAAFYSFPLVGWIVGGIPITLFFVVVIFVTERPDMTQQSRQEQITGTYYQVEGIDQLVQQYNARQLQDLRGQIPVLTPDNIDLKVREAIQSNIDKFAQLVKLEGHVPPENEVLVEHCFQKSAPIRERLKKALKKYLRQQILGDIPVEEEEEVQPGLQDEIDKLLRQYEKWETDKEGKT